MLVFAFQSEIWIAQNLNFTIFKDFCLSSSWKYRFSQNVNHTKVQSKTNKYCKFHDDLTRRRLTKSQFKKLGVVPKKLYRNTLSGRASLACSGRTLILLDTQLFALCILQLNVLLKHFIRKVQITI